MLNLCLENLPITASQSSIVALSDLFFYLAAEETPMEPNSIHSVEFMVLKHRADLLYSQRHYKDALKLYKRVLTAVPESNTCVSREIRDAIARSQLKLGHGEQAKMEAEKMVSLPGPSPFTGYLHCAEGCSSP